MSEETDPGEALATLQSKVYEAQAEAKSLRIQLEYARSELIDARAELKQYSASLVESYV